MEFCCSWIDASLAALEKAVCGEVVRQASELTYKLHLSSSDYIDTQPADDSVWYRITYQQHS